MAEPSKYLAGRKHIAQYFNLSVSELEYLIENNGIPGVIKIKRKATESFPGGGAGVWVIRRELAERYRHTRAQTPRYDPRNVTLSLLNKYPDCRSIPEIIKAGYMDDLDWCMALDRERERCNLHVPILMHRADLHNFMRNRYTSEAKRSEMYPETNNIFKSVRKKKGEK